MSQCHCIKLDGTRCTRKTGTIATDNPLFCWQHQKCTNSVENKISETPLPILVSEHRIVPRQSAQTGEIVLPMPLPRPIETKQLIQRGDSKKSTQSGELDRCLCPMPSVKPPMEVLSAKKKPNMKNVFPSKAGIDLKKLWITDNGLMFITPWKEAQMITKWILQYYKGASAKLTPMGSGLTITDGTSSIGGNVIGFYLNGFTSVNACEINPVSSQILLHNLLTYNLPISNVYCCDYMTIYKHLTQDVVFLDPPWGGSDYKKSTSLDLFMSGVNVSDLTIELLRDKRASLVALKVPYNFNFDSLDKKIIKNKSKMNIRKVFRGEHHSYTMIFCW